MDAVQKANSGHPGTAMALAPLAYVLYARGHAARPERPRLARSRPLRALGRSRLHAAVRAAPPDRLRPVDGRPRRQFRQWGSSTPGHPELRHTPGVEATTGPLGQGVGNAVGMAIAERMLAARFNRPGHEIVDHRTFAICSDGDMMEGVSRRGRRRSPGTSASASSSSDLRRQPHHDRGLDRPRVHARTCAARYEAYGWHVQRVDDDVDARHAARGARGGATPRPSGRRSSRSARTSPTARRHAQDTAKAHGAPLGEEEIRADQAGATAGTPTSHFFVPDGVYEHDGRSAPRGADRARASGSERPTAYRAAHPELAAEFERALAGELPDGWERGAARPLGRRAAGDARELERRASQRRSRRPCPSSSAAPPTSLRRRTR